MPRSPGQPPAGLTRHTGRVSGHPIDRLLADPPDLPVCAGLADLAAAVRTHGAAVVQAPPGTGKTTLVPPALAALVDDLATGSGGRVVVTQPRRIAARAAARRLAFLLGEAVGATAGYAVRGDRRTSAATRVEFVTTGVLVRRLQRDPDLPGVGAVVLDEVHERHLDDDLALALLVDVRAHLRPDLPLVAMSATVEAARTAALIGGSTPVPVIAVPGAMHPVAQHWRPAPPRTARTDERGVTPGFLDHVAAVTREALRENDGDILVFVPGVAEIDGTARRLAGVDADVRPLHGRLSHRDQDLALAAGPRRRVVISTSVAESSLTVPGVRVVVDAGLARQPRTDHRRGLAGLVTVSVSRSGAEQRAGRAGREGPGAVYRCWTAAEHGRLPPHPEPEVATADLTSFALELACWGNPGGAGLALMDPPPNAAMGAAHAALQGIGAVYDDGKVTERGRAIAAVGADPRLARALLDGAPLVGSRRAAEVVALLSGDVRAPGGDLVAALRSLRRAGQSSEPASAAWRVEVRRLQAASTAAEGSEHLSDDLAVGLIVALAHPDRIARRRPGGSTYLMASGTGAALPPAGSALAGLDWLAVADADRGAGRADATVRSAAPLDEHLALLAAPALLREQEQVSWQRGRLAASSSTRLGAIELRTSSITHPSRELVAAAVRDGLAAEGLALLPWSTSAVALRQRLAFLHRALGPPWPDVSDDALLAAVEAWLGPDLDRVLDGRDLRRVDVLAALRRLLPWPAAGRFAELAPERVAVPSGSSVRIDYDAEQPVLAVRVQEVFGWATTPRIADNRVPLLLHLLTPARRPIAVTSDLESFWHNTYPQVRGELRARYPRHAWPEDPTTAAPTRGTRRPSSSPRRPPP